VYVDLTSAAAPLLTAALALTGHVLMEVDSAATPAGLLTTHAPEVCAAARSLSILRILLGLDVRILSDLLIFLILLLLVLALGQRS
jgi:hypothetical protein